MNVSFDKDFIYEYKLQGYEIERNEDDLVCDYFMGFYFCVDDDICTEPKKTNESERKTLIIQEKGETLLINNLN